MSGPCAGSCPLMTRRTLLRGALAATTAATAATVTGRTAADAHSANPGLIFPPGPKGWWDSERVSVPRVLRLADGSWKMWYYGRDAGFDRDIALPTGRVGHAVSSDGLNWERVRGPLTLGAVFEPHPDPARFDSGHVGISDISFDGRLYWMWYFGGPQSTMRRGSRVSKGFPLRAGCAVSGDGINWTRLEGPHAGALIDAGGPNAFDAGICGWPTVLEEDDGSFKLYYHTLNPAQGFAVCLATSRDRLSWTKLGKVLGAGMPGRFDEKGAATRDVIKIDGRYLMLYEGVMTGGYRSIGLAVSGDGISWTKQTGTEKNGSVFSHAPRGSGRWDAYAVGAPCLVKSGERYRMYYIGSNEAAGDVSQDRIELSITHQIGVAESRDSTLTSWQRVVV
jgi:hypothetical protein